MKYNKQKIEEIVREELNEVLGLGGLKGFSEKEIKDIALDFKKELFRVVSVEPRIAISYFHGGGAIDVNWGIDYFREDWYERVESKIINVVRNFNKKYEPFIEFGEAAETSGRGVFYI